MPETGESVRRVERCIRADDGPRGARSHGSNASVLRTFADAIDQALRALRKEDGRYGPV